MKAIDGPGCRDRPLASASDQGAAGPVGRRTHRPVWMSLPKTSDRAGATATPHMAGGPSTRGENVPTRLGEVGSEMSRAMMPFAYHDENARFPMVWVLWIVNHPRWNAGSPTRWGRPENWPTRRYSSTPS